MSTARKALNPRQGGSRGPARVGAANLRDVAARAGVSPATASRVFGGHSNVHADTRARVLAAADELGYVVNGLARAMTGRGPGTVAFVVRSMIGPTFASLAAGAESVASRFIRRLPRKTSCARTTHASRSKAAKARVKVTD